MSIYIYLHNYIHTETDIYIHIYIYIYMEHLYFYLDHPEFRASVLPEGREGPEGGAEAGDVAQLLLHLGRLRSLGKPGNGDGTKKNHGKTMGKPWENGD